MNQKVSSPKNEKKSWAVINKIKKEEKRKWKQEKLLKKYEKQKLKDSLKKSVEINDIKISSKTNINVSTSVISTVSIAIPGSILENSQSLELQTYLAGQIARAACIFQIDEIIIYDDFGDEANAKKSELEDTYGLKTIRKNCALFGRILQYIECPQYLRKHFFPIHKDLQYCGMLHPLNAPHHLLKDDTFTFREGVVTNNPVKPGKGSIVNVGLLKLVQVDKLLTPSIRCTVKLLPTKEGTKKLKGIIVSPSTPRQETGIYWGYNIRLANSLSQIFSQSPYPKGYDLTIGTSDKGTSVDEFTCPSYNHLLIVFGGVDGLESALENDNLLNADEPHLLFNHYLNTVPNQGSKTIRTEEAVLISLASLRSKLNPCNPSTQFNSQNLNNIDLSKFD